MRHGDKVNNLGRKVNHRRALLKNLAVALITNKNIVTTTAKAKALRGYVEPMITRAKKDDTHSRREVFSKLQDGEAVKALFGEIAEKVATRPGGYTRIIKINHRPGDNADMAMIELVDFAYTGEETTTSATKEKAAEKKRTRRGGKKKSTEPSANDAGNKKEVRSSTKANTPKIRQRKTGGS
jgi:large subunit ribosomal protein L17